MDRYDDFLETALKNFRLAKDSLGPEIQAKHSNPTLLHLSYGLCLLTQGILQERDLLDLKLKELEGLLRQTR